MKTNNNRVYAAHFYSLESPTIPTSGFGVTLNGVHTEYTTLEKSGSDKLALRVVERTLVCLFINLSWRSVHSNSALEVLCLAHPPAVSAHSIRLTPKVGNPSCAADSLREAAAAGQLVGGRHGFL